MDRSHELIDQWIGQPVLIQTVTGPNPSQDEIQLLIDNPDGMIFGSVRVSAQVLELVAYDSFGVLLRQRTDRGGRGSAAAILGL